MSIWLDKFPNSTYDLWCTVSWSRCKNFWRTIAWCSKALNLNRGRLWWTIAWRWNRRSTVERLWFLNWQALYWYSWNDILKILVISDGKTLTKLLLISSRVNSMNKTVRWCHFTWFVITRNHLITFVLKTIMKIIISPLFVTIGSYIVPWGADGCGCR